MRTAVGVTGATLRGMRNKKEGVVRYSVDLGNKKQKNSGHGGAHAQAVGKQLTGTGLSRVGTGWMRMC